MKNERDAQLKVFTSARVDSIEEEEGKIWYIMDSAWITSWLAYVQFNKDVSPAPGPCKNHRLLVPDFENSCWKAKPNLVMATTGKKTLGDYRRVSREVWENFCIYYPGCGPEIKTTFTFDPARQLTGLYPTDTWEIDNTKYSQESGQTEKKKSRAIERRKELDRKREAQQKEKDEKETEAKGKK